MEPTKFEKRIKSQLDQREIQPGEQLWENINAQLRQEKSPLKSRRKVVLFSMSAAAVVLVMVSLGLRFSQKEQHISPVIEVVDTSQDEVDRQEKTIKKIEITPEAPVKIALKKEINTFTLPPVKDRKKIEKPIRISKVSPHEMLAIYKVKDSFAIRSDQVINQKVNAVLAEVQSLEKNNITLTELEVDSLLRKAQHEILNQQYNRLPLSIDAMALLDEVEYEIDVTIKNKLFEALKKGFREVRTAVAERNQ